VNVAFFLFISFLFSLFVCSFVSDVVLWIDELEMVDKSSTGGVCGGTKAFAAESPASRVFPQQPIPQQYLYLEGGPVVVMSIGISIA
jgi:hypothetical protein